MTFESAQGYKINVYYLEYNIYYKAETKMRTPYTDQVVISDDSDGKFCVSLVSCLRYLYS